VQLTFPIARKALCASGERELLGQPAVLAVRSVPLQRQGKLQRHQVRTIVLALAIHKLPTPVRAAFGACAFDLETGDIFGLAQRGELRMCNKRTLPGWRR